MRADLNNALAALITNSSGATSPASTYAFQFWADTTASQLKIRNAANDAWIVLMELDGTMLMEDGTAAAPGLSFASDTDTGIFRPAANQLGIATSGVERVEFGATEVVFNDSGADVDLRVEGDAEANLLKVDAGNDRIGIAESAPGTLIEIGSTAPYVTLKNSTEEDTDGGRESRLIFEGEQSGGEISTLAQVEVSHDGTADDEKGKLVISTNDGSDGASPTAALTISSDQTVAIADNLTVNGNQYPTAGALSHRNLVINGAANVAQRATSTTGLTAGSYPTVDRFAWTVSNCGTWTSTQESDGPVGFSNSFKVLCTTADASPAALDFAVLQYILEAQDLQHLNYGTSDAVPITVSFWVKSNKTGNASFAALQFDASNRTFSKAYTINSANTWEYKTITIPADASGQIDDNNDKGLVIEWWSNSGTDFSSGSHPTTWTANDDSDRNASNIGIGQAVNDYFQITGIQLEVGSKATPFEHRSYGDELARCQRYYQESDINEYYQLPTASGAQVQRQKVTFPVTMRANANVTRTKVDGNATISSDGSTTQGFRSGFGGSAGDIINYSWTAVAEL